MTTVTISLPESLREFLDRQVSTKGYGNTSEYLRELLREARKKESADRLEALLIEGIDPDEDIPLTREFWRELKAEAARMLARKHHTRVKS